MNFTRPIANPILTRELRARWRNGLSSVLLFCYAIILALAAGMVYASATFSSHDARLLRQMAETGHTLFLTLSGLQIAAWMLLGPALTATSIAGERERGLLEMLQLTPLSARRICGGKLMSVLSFVLLVMFAPLPMTALCFLLGGVSPGEFVAAFALQMATAVGGLCFGLWASSWSRRATTGMTLALGITIVWNVLSFIIFIAHEARSPWVNMSSAMSAWQSIFLDGVWRINPLLVFLTENLDARSRTGSSWLSTYATWDAPDSLFCIALQLLFAGALIASTSRALWRPLDDDDAEKQPKRRSSTRSRRNTSVTNEQSATPASSATPALLTHTASKRAWEIAPLARFRSGNPVLEREVRRWSRAPRLGRVVARWTRLAALLVGGIYALGLIYLFGDPERRGNELFWLLAGVGIFLSALIACGLGAVLFTREREAGTWQGVQLSLLSPRQILRGKIVPSWCATLAFCVLFWLPALLCVNVSWSSGFSSNDRIRFSHWLFSLLIATGTTWLCLTWSALLSAYAARIWLAVAWAIGSLLALFVALPLFVTLGIGLFGGYSYDYAMMTFFRVWHPVFALSMLSYNEYSTNRYHVSPSGATLHFLLFNFAVGALFLGLTHRRLRRDLRL